MTPAKNPYIGLRSSEMGDFRLGQILGKAIIVLFTLFSLASGVTGAAELTISCGAVGQELELCRAGAQAWATRFQHTVKVITAPSNSSDRLTQYQLMLAAHSSDIDVFVIDTTWPGAIGDFFVDLSGSLSPAERESQFPAFMTNNTLKGRLVARPWFIDAGVLYYRDDLLKKHSASIPKTWRELTETATRIQEAERKIGSKKLWGYVFQGRAYEGLTCNALEWVASSGGGTWVTPEGKIEATKLETIQALELAASWVGTIAPQGVLNYMEEDSRGVFQSGDSVFMRNWPYAWKLVQSPDSPVRGKVGMTVLPKGGAPGSFHAGTLGGWSLAVSRYSKNRDAAVHLVRFLSSESEQKRRALAAGLYPTWTSLYRDPEILKQYPQMRELYPAFQQAVPRPSRSTGALYNRVSTEIWDAVHDVLTRKAAAPERMQKLQRELERISKKEKW